MILPRTPARSSIASWSLVGLLVVVMKISIRGHSCGGLDATLAKPCRALTEEAEVCLLYSLPGVNSHFIAQQDAEAFVRCERLSHVAACRKRTHQEQMPRFSERDDLYKFAGGTLRARQLRARERQTHFRVALQCADPHIGKVG